MQIKIKINLNSTLTLPLSYHHILQSVIYNLMRDRSGQAFLHDNGEYYGSRVFKLFTFGQLNGRYRIKNRTITFFEEVSFEVRSVDDDTIWTMDENIHEQGIRFGDQVFKDVITEITDIRVMTPEPIIRMASPICVYETDLTGHTRYFNPTQPLFAGAVNDNFIRKFAATVGAYPEEGVFIKPIDIRPQDKYITKYKGFIIEAYKGTYKLLGRPEYLDFMYQVGLGSKNAQGFGMFEIVD